MQTYHNLQVGLPPGKRSSEHWVARNVALLVCADPGQLLNSLQS